jgi:quercetin dioxygenase-like cupin family protein
MDDPIAQPTPLAELVDYQAGSVVSRVLLRNEGGVMTLFAFAEGQGLSEHSTPHDASVLVLEGEVEVDVAGDCHNVSTGQILHLPPSVPHSLHGKAPFKMLLTILKVPLER